MEEENIKTWQDFETFVASELAKREIVFKQEEQQVSRGHKAGNGKFDFDIKGYTIDAIECKQVSTLSKLTIPKHNTSTTIKGHQIKALRATPNESGILIHETGKQRFLWCNMQEYERLILIKPRRRSFTGLDELEIDVYKLFDRIKKVEE